MKHLCCSVGVALMCTMGGMAQAAIACEIVSPSGTLTEVLFYSEPTEKADRLRNLPVGDLVFYSNDDLAPDQVEGWVWVRHDETQEEVFRNGDFGWLRAENIDICG